MGHLKCDSHNLLKRAAECHQCGRQYQARQICQRILNVEPNLPEALHLLGSIEYAQGRREKAQGRFEEAIKSYQKKLQLQPRDADTCFSIGELYGRLGGHEDAALWYTKGLAIRPDDARAYFKLGIIESQKGRLAAAAGCYQRALELDPGMAEAWNNLGLVYKSCNDLDQAVRCFQKGLQSDPEFAEAYYNLGNAYYLQKRVNHAILCFQKVLEIKPDSSAVQIRLGDLLNEQGRPEKALAYYEKACELEPDSAELWNKIGNIYKGQGNFTKAAGRYRRAIELNPNAAEALFNAGYVLVEVGEVKGAVHFYERLLAIEPNSAETMYNLATLLAKNGELDAAVHYTRQAIKNSPDRPDAHNNLGLYLRAQEKIDEAIREFKKAIAIDSHWAKAHLNLSLALLVSGQFAEGWDEYDWRFEVDRYKADFRYRGADIWDGRAFSGKRLLVHDEQGFGDTLQFVRYLPHVKKLGGTVIFEVRKAIIPLLDGFPGIDQLLERPVGGGANVKYDYYLPLLSVAGRLGTRLDCIPAKIPYLLAAPTKVARWKAETARPGFKIGLVWAGSQLHVNDGHRSCSLGQLEWLLHFPDTALFSLQKEVNREEEKQLNQMGIVDLGSRFNDFADTAAVIELLDLVIAVDTAVVHLAGAMGKPVWVVLPFDSDWRWLMNRDDSPWYPTMRLFRQKAVGDWDTAFRSVEKSLRELLGRPNTS
ncbi:MAG: tetratricopeptide repeat protein [Desulfobacterales bacterium]|nr:MAG: tetratricopeptide repeat protein [Desulfobacterales bacterium]